MEQGSASDSWDALLVLYGGETFRGYDRVHLPYAKLDRIFKRECPRTTTPWGNYLDSQHGGNKKLRELYNNEGEGYFRENFEFRCSSTSA